MKRSNIVLFTTIIAIIEVILVCVGANEKYRFVNSTLEFKYGVMCIIAYVGATIASVWHLIMNVDNSERETRSKYLESFGTEHVNFLFTYHFLLFSVLCFALDMWPWSIMGAIMFFVHNYVHRDNQNKYALEYEIEEAKAAARKPVVLNASDDLL